MFFRKPDRAILLDIWTQARGYHTVNCTNLARMEKALMSMMEDVKAKMDHMDDVVKAAVSAFESMKTAYDYLKSHPVVMEDPALKDVADKLDADAKALSDAVAKVNASGAPA